MTEITSPAWEQQYRRVLRYFDRVWKRQGSRDDYEDAVWCFFMNCWHLKDWFKNDDGLRKNLRDQIVDDAHRSGDLKVCQALCNRQKHFAPHSGDPEKDFGWHASFDPCTRFLDWIVILDDGSAIEVLKLATRAVDEWKRILEEHGLGQPHD